MNSKLDTVLHNLNKNVQRTGRVLPGELEVIFSSIQKVGSCTSNQALLLLRCCGSILPDLKFDERQKLLGRLWDNFEEQNIVLDSSHYNARLKVYIDNEHEFNPSEYLSDMETNGIDTNRVTYQYLIAKYCQVNALQSLSQIHSKCFTLDWRYFGSNHDSRAHERTEPLRERERVPLVGIRPLH